MCDCLVVAVTRCFFLGQLGDVQEVSEELNNKDSAGGEGKGIKANKMKTIRLGGGRGHGRVMEGDGRRKILPLATELLKHVKMIFYSSRAKYVFFLGLFVLL